MRLTPTQGPAGGPLRARQAAGVIAGCLLAGILTAVGGPIAVILGTAAVSLGWLGYARPGILFAAYLAVPFYKGFVQEFSPVDITLILGVLCAAQAFILLSGRQGHASPSAIARWCALTTLVIAGCLYAPDTTAAVAVAITWTALVFLPMFAAIRVASDERHVKDFITTLLGFGILFAIGGLLALPGFQESRLAFLSTNTINTGRAAILVPVIAVGYLGGRGSSMLRLVAVVLAPAAIFAGLASGARGPLLMGAVVVVPTGLWALARRASARLRFAVLGSIAGGSLLFAAMFSQSLPSASVARIGEFFAFLADPGGGAESTIGARQLLFDLALRMFQDQPLLGWGTGAFRARASLEPAIAQFSYPHNAPLEFAATYGIIGLAIFGWFVFGAFRRGLSQEPHWRAIGLVLMFWLLNGLVSGGIYEDRMLWGLLLLMQCRPSAPGLQSERADIAQGGTRAASSGCAVEREPRRPSGLTSPEQCQT